MAISFYNKDIEYKISKPRKVKNWLKSIIEHYGYSIGSINIIFCSEEVIIDINRNYLNHDYYTDVITFPYTSGLIISTDIYVSLPTVQTNSIKYNQNFEFELRRVIVHAILHLVGFSDQNSRSKKNMTSAEDHWLSIFFNLQ